MKNFNTKSFAEHLQIPVEENTVSLLIDPDSGAELPSPDELRELFEIADGDDCADYGELKVAAVVCAGEVPEELSLRLMKAKLKTL